MTELIENKSSFAVHRNEEFEIDLKVVLNLIKHSYKLIAVIITICLIAGIYYAETRPPLYRSTAMIEVGNNSISGAFGSSGAGGGGVAELAGLTSLQSSTAAVESVLLQSPYVLSQVARQLNLDISVSPHDPGFFGRKWAEFRDISSGTAAVSFLKVPNNLLDKTLILRVQDNNHYTLFTEDGKKLLTGAVGQLASTAYFSEPVEIKVSALHARPGEKFDVVKQPLTDVANSIGLGLGMKEAGEGTGILELNYTSGNREQAQKLLNSILAVAVAKNVEEKSQEASKTLQFISQQLPISENTLERTEKKFNQYSAASGIFDTKGGGAFLESEINNLRQTLEELKFKKMAMLQKFTPLHPMVIALTQKEQEIRAQINSIKKKLQQFPEAAEKGIGIQRNMRIQSEIYTTLVTNAQKMEMIKASAISSVRVLSPATYPISRIPVKKKVIVFGSVLFGFMISLAIIFIRHLLSPVIEDPDVVERMLGIAVAAIIPCSQSQANYDRKMKYDKLYANTKSFLLARENFDDAAIEGIRSLRTAVQMSLIGAKNNVIVITGCSPSVGKSFISSNLATLLSDLGKRILLIDSDMRLGKLNECFGKVKAPGLSAYLKNEANLEEIIQNVIPDRLDLITSGLYPKNPSELLSQALLNTLIQVVKSRYDFVIIDTPPVLAVTDSALILRHSSVNLMVLGVGKDQMKEAIYAKNILEKAEISLTGIVFNTLKQSKSGFGYNYGYANYQYRYGQDK